MDITAALVKELREKSGAGMMDCKKALSENNGNIEKAIDWLRTKGLAVAAKKADRTASEGLIGIHISKNSASMVEVNAETDFVGRNKLFQEFVLKVAETALKTKENIDLLKSTNYPGENHTVEEELIRLIATIGENIKLRRACAISVKEGSLSTYIHNQTATGLGKIGVLVGLSSSSNSSVLEDLGKQLAMHIAASSPIAISREELDPELINRERNILLDQARESGKPEEIIEKMVEGRIRKYFEEVCLLDQIFAIDGETRVVKVLEKFAEEMGAPIAITSFAIFKLGDGIEKEENDFAAEVATTAGV